MSVYRSQSFAAMLAKGLTGMLNAEFGTGSYEDLRAHPKIDGSILVVHGSAPAGGREGKREIPAEKGDSLVIGAKNLNCAVVHRETQPWQVIALIGNCSGQRLGYRIADSTSRK